MSDIRRARKALVVRILEGGGESSHAQRRAAFDNTETAEPPSTLIRKVAKHASKVTDDDIAALRTSGFSEDQVFEIVMCAAIGQAARQYEAALTALDASKGGDAHATRSPR
jgi:alkylhydroperoxidase family enzyme